MYCTVKKIEYSTIFKVSLLKREKLECRCYCLKNYLWEADKQFKFKIKQKKFYNRTK